MRTPLPIAAFVGLLLLSCHAYAADSDGIFIVGTTAKTPEAVAAEVRSYSEQQRWIFLSENKVKQDEVTLVKICIPEVGKLAWQAGLQVSALLPCGNLGIYANGAMTEISLLHPRYMHLLHPDPALEQAGALAEPLLLEMLEAVTK